MRMKKNVLVGTALLCAIGSLAPTAKAADPKSHRVPAGTVVTEQTTLIVPVQPEPVEVLRSELRTGKTAVIARLLNFTSEEQAANFWTVYRHYQADLAEINDHRLAIINDYIAAYRDLDDAAATSLMKRSLEQQLALVKLRQKYADELSSKTSPVVAASFLQIEGVLESLVELEVKSNIPLLADRLRASRQAEIIGKAE